MKINLGDNLRRLRRERGLTQEALAEALGVSIGAVYKWESGRSLPELPLVLEMASLFELSVDALLGYELQGDAAEELVEDIERLKKSRQFSAARDVSERALKKYPNHFGVVYGSAALYQVMGLVGEDSEALGRAIQLFQRSLPLLSQNEDPRVDEHTIRNQIASCYYNDQKIDQALEVFRDNNVYGINNATIGFVITSEKASVDEAIPYLSEAFLDLLTTTLSTVLGWTNYYAKKKDYQAARESVEWLIAFLESVKTDGPRNASLEKILVVLHAACADYEIKLQNDESARRHLITARDLAQAHDQLPPSNSLKGLRFFLDEDRSPVAFDSLPDSAIAAAEESLQDESTDEKTRTMWKEVTDARN